MTAAAAWPVNPPLLAVLAFGLLFALGGRNRASRRARTATERWRAVSFYGGLVSVLVALDSPLDPLADKLFAAHMAQHVLLLTVAPPLIVFGAPWTRIWRPLPLGFRRSVAKWIALSARARPLRAAGRFVMNPVVSLALFSVNLALWHIPALFDATLRSGAVHDTEHLLFFTTGLLVWAQVLESPPLHVRLDLLWRAALTTAAMLVGWVLAVVLAFAPTPLYEPYVVLAHRTGGLTALGDQQIAAGVMWVPGSLTFTVAIIVFFYRWLGPETETPSGRRLHVGPSARPQPTTLSR